MDIDVSHLGFKLYYCFNDYEVSYKANDNNQNIIGNSKDAEKLGPYGTDEINTVNVENKNIIIELCDSNLKEILKRKLQINNSFVLSKNKDITLYNILSWITWNGVEDQWKFLNTWFHKFYLHNDIIPIEKLMNKISEQLHKKEPSYLMFYSFIDKWDYYKKNDGSISLNILFDSKVELNKEIQILLMTYHLLYICYKENIKYIRFT